MLREVVFNSRGDPRERPALLDGWMEQTRVPSGAAFFPVGKKRGRLSINTLETTRSVMKAKFIAEN